MRALLKFCALNFFLWRHFAKSSDLLFNVFSLFDFMINSFSSKQRLHDLPPAMYAGTHLIIDHLMVNSLPVSFRFQAYFDNSVSLAYFACVKDFLWLL